MQEETVLDARFYRKFFTIAQLKASTKKIMAEVWARPLGRVGPRPIFVRLTRCA